MKVRIANLFVAAATSVALVASPAVAAPQGPARTNAAVAVDARAGADSDADSELFRGRRGGALGFILIAVVIAIGVYIVVDDDNESPASP